MQVIRLQRVGKKNQPSFRIVLQEKSWAVQGKAQELLGFYNPVSKEKAFQEERIVFWMSKGARLSPTVHNLLVDAGIVKGEKIKAWRPKVKAKKDGDAEGGPSAEKPEEKAQDTSKDKDTKEEPAQETDVKENEKANDAPKEDPKPKEDTDKKEEITPEDDKKEEKSDK